MSPLPILASAATGIQVGAAIVATRFVVDQTGPASLALLRYLIGFLCLLPALLAMKSRMRMAARDLLAIGLLGVAQFGILIALLNYGLRTVPSARAALILALFPLLTMIVAALVGRERLSVAKTMGVLLTLAGVAIALGEKASAAGTADNWVGEIAVFAGALIGAVCTVLYRPYLARYPTLPVGAFAMLASVGFLALLAFPEGLVATLPAITARGWLAVLFIGVSSGVGYYLWLWALSRATPTRVSVFLGLSPITAALLGALLLGEPVTQAVLAGLGFVVVGLVVAHRPAPDPAREPASGSLTPARSRASNA